MEGMDIIFYLAMALLPVGIILPIVFYYMGEKNKRRGRRALVGNLVCFVSTFTFATVYLFSARVYATGVSAADDTALAAALIGAGITTGLACVGAGIATGSAASAAIGAVSENDAMMGKALIFVAMAEGIAIYGLLIAFMILNRV